MYVVGIGASAGGLEALFSFVEQLSPSNNMSYVIVQHLPADKRSALVELLKSKAKLSVEEAADGVGLCANTIYVAPAGRDIEIDKGCLKLLSASLAPAPKTTIDYFFYSLAEAYQEKAVGVIFSGTGHDGAKGIKAIKAAGGLTIAQQPATAKFKSMPEAAIEQGRADIILSPAEAALELGLIAKNLDIPVTEGKETQLPPEIRVIVDDILKVTGMDFVNYKNSTVIRQVNRRMAILHIDDLGEYVQFTKGNPEELSQLAKSFLVCVTSFFRDAQCFNALRVALKKILTHKKAGDYIRVWVPGCATGEEAYSIAMILAEELGAEISRYRVQIYGTDINAEAIQTARKGTYDELSLIALDCALKAKYFTEDEYGFIVNKSLRDLIIFSRHDLVKSPPFIRVDLISCRNLLIYFNQALQEQILKIFHYALVSQGILFLGQAESLWSLSDAFIELNRNSKLFVKNDSHIIRPGLDSKSLMHFNANRDISSVMPVHLVYKLLGQDKLVDIYAPPSILASREGKILEFYKSCEAFIKIKKGKADFNLFSIIDPSLKTELKAFCHSALSRRETVTSQTMMLTADEKTVHYRIIVTPVYQESFKEELLLISFQEVERNPEIIDTDQVAVSRLVEMEQELQMARETLRTVTVALETNVDAWQVLNEEVQAANEELQSTNEELETSNEELQSINEELTQVNNELSLKTRELKEANDDLRNVLDSMDKAVIVVDSRMHINRINEASKKYFNGGFIDGTEQPNLNTLKNALGCEDLIGRIQQVIDTGATYHSKLPIQKKYFELVIYPYFSRNIDTVTGAVLTIQDITEQCLAEEQIRLAASVFGNANEAIVITDAGNQIISINPAFTEITGYEKAEVVGKNPSILSSKRQSSQFYESLWQSIKDTGKWQGEIFNKRKDGSVYPEWLSISTLKDESGKVLHYIGIFTDISAAYKDRETIIQQANYDALTHLPNRNLFFDRLKQAIANAGRARELVGVMFIDLDGFKDINDALGHSLGDILLQRISQRMVGILRESDSLARFGGDEFTVLVTGLQKEADIIPTVEKILEAIQAPIVVDDHELNVTASIGITVFPNDGKDGETLLKYADSAMYTAKAEGRNAYRFFTPSMHEKAKIQHSLSNDIKIAIKNNQFTVHYQPVYDLFRKRIVGAEALLRWQHPLRGNVSPEEFIPLAESLNLISKIGELVLSEACRFMAGLNRILQEPLYIAINFSPLQFVAGNCAENWIDIIESSGMNSSHVIVEITESLMMSHQANYMLQLQLLKQQGIRIAMDDFGTGFSSLSYLKKLPLDILKIDQSFIRDVLWDPNDAALIETIIAIAKNYSLELVCEGVEEKGQVDFLVQRGCRYAQGFYIQRPVPGEQFIELAKNGVIVT
ncbi:EAL domain-containing protein [Methylomicrobium album]|uniref:PAS domain S-box/diguanylate cyclase (GGDEF) domain-containing protein n=1 Tax=Methylomicrobium album BG8 TaxID=686340 RepID=H8GJU0_METAL|nr:EAL domain-containing protein [Methylomicrobium album]EIC31619.1 PAS domain S-box/diguanylate cyclase (GGDEF) domain-containing protein [Methylomicrobium album BG8]